jgi:hypothetical protein
VDSLDEPRGHALRRRVGGLLLFFALVAGSAAYATVIVRGIVIDSDIAGQAANRALDDERVQHLLVKQTAGALRSQLLGEEGQSALARDGYDPSGDLDAVAAAIVAAPQFRSAFVGGVRSLHDAVFKQGPAPTIDATPLVELARNTAIQRNPVYGGLMPPTATLTVSIPAKDLPDLSGIDRTLGEKVKTLTVAAAALAALGLAIHSRRARAVRRIGMWFVSTALLQAAIAFALPVAASAIGNDAGPIAEALARTLLPRLLAPAALVCGVGICIAVVGHRWQRTLDRRHARLGAHAFLEGEDVPIFFDGPIETANLRSPLGAPPVSRVAPRDDRSPLPPSPLFDVPAGAPSRRNGRVGAR